jgi:hypothetical protein
LLVAFNSKIKSPTSYEVHLVSMLKLLGFFFPEHLFSRKEQQKPFFKINQKIEVKKPINCFIFDNWSLKNYRVRKNFTSFDVG